MRFTSTAFAAAVVTAAFVAGRVTGMQSPQLASAQPTVASPGVIFATVPPDGGVGGAPGMFSHFKCYQTAVKLPKPANVLLSDQFGTSRMQLIYADLFCTPVKKQLIGANPLPVPGPADHLLCYRGEAPPVAQTRLIANQLQRAEIQITLPRYLCVPTWKGRATRTPPPQTAPPTPRQTPTPTPTPRRFPTPNPVKTTLTIVTPNPVKTLITLTPHPQPTTR
jgi:hypothetical protein